MTDMVTIEWPNNNPPSSDAEFWKQYLTEEDTAPAVKEITMPKQFKAIKLNVLVEGAKGGGGSGNFGHRGRPGHLGGSVGGTGAGGGGSEPTTSPISKAQSKAEDAAFKRLTAKLDATQNLTGKPKPAPGAEMHIGMTPADYPKPTKTLAQIKDVSQQLADKVKLAGQMIGEAKATGGSKAHATAVSAIMNAIEQAKAEGMDNTVALLRKSLAKQQKFVDYWKKVEASHIKK